MVWNIWIMFPLKNIGDVILPIDELHHLSRWFKHVKTTNQKKLAYLILGTFWSCFCYEPPNFSLGNDDNFDVPSQLWGSGGVNPGNRPWDYWKLCQKQRFSQISFPSTPPSVLAKRPGNGSELWASSRWVKDGQSEKLSSCPSCNTSNIDPGKLT